MIKKMIKNLKEPLESNVSIYQSVPLLFLLMMLNIADACLTSYAINMNIATEMNPIMLNIVGGPFLLSIKILVLYFVLNGAFIRTLKRQKQNRLLKIQYYYYMITIYLGVCVYAWVVNNNIIVILNGLKG